MAKLEILNQAKGFYNKLTKQQKVIGISVLSIIFAGLLIMILATGTHEEWKVLYSSLEEKDAAKIVEKLKEKNIEYELKDEGSTIMVKAGQAYDVRLDMAKEGLPEDGVAGYELFDQTNLGMSEFVQKLNYRRALEGELAKTIQASDDITKARVHIVIPEKALFEKDQKKPTASIVLTLKSGDRSMGRIHVEGIQNLVAGSVEGMSPNDVTVINTRGKILSPSPVDDQSVAGLTSMQYDQVKHVEEYYKQKVQSMLDGFLGVGNSEVRITAELNFTQIEKTITEYDAENTAIRSEQTIGENSSSTDSLSYPAVNMQKNQTNVISNYEVPKTVEKIVNQIGNITRLSVAVVVNGKDSVVEVDGNPKIINNPMPDSTQQSIKLLVEKAMGYDPARNDQIELLYVPFMTYDTEEILKDYYQKKWWKTKWWEESDNVKLISLIIVIILTLIIIFGLLKSKFIKDRIRIALALPEHVKVEDDDETTEEEVEDEELEEIMIDDDELMLVPAELPDQLLLEGDREEKDYEELSEDEEGFDKDSLASRARASISEGEAVEMTEDAVMKLELKNKVENFVGEQPSEAVKLVRFFLAQDIEKSAFNL